MTLVSGDITVTKGAVDDEFGIVALIVAIVGFVIAFIKIKNY